MGFLGLVKLFEPNLVNLYEFRDSSPVIRLETAFRLAHDHLSIPRLLEVSGKINGKDLPSRRQNFYFSTHHTGHLRFSCKSGFSACNFLLAKHARFCGKRIVTNIAEGAFVGL